MRLICWLFGGHAWDDWREVVIAGWTTNMQPEARLCRRCLAIEENAAAHILSRIAFG